MLPRKAIHLAKVFIKIKCLIESKNIEKIGDLSRG